MSSNFFDRERAALVRLTDAVRSRAAAEAELTAGFQAAADKAEREVNRTRKTNAAAREKELGEIDAAHAAAAQEIAGRFDAEQFTVNRAREEKRVVTVEKYRAAEQKGRAEYQDRLWSIDSVLEGKEKRARDQMDLLQRRAAAGKDQVEGLWAQAVVPLAKTRVGRAEVEQAAVTHLPSDDDPISSMQKAITSAESALEDLRNLFLPKLANLGGLVLCVLVAAGVGAGAGFALLDLVPALGVTGGVGLVGGVGLWLLLRSAARKRTVRAGSVLGEQLAAAAAACQHLHEFAAVEYAAEHARLVEKHARKRRETDAYYVPLLDAQKRQYESELGKLVDDHAAATESIRARREGESRAEEEGYRARRAGSEARLDGELRTAEEVYAGKTAVATATREAAWERTAGEWRAVLAEVGETFRTLRDEGARLFPEWEAVGRDGQKLPAAVPQGVRFGEIGVDMQALPDGISADERLAPPADLSGPLPAFLPFPDQCSVVLKARDDGRAVAVNALQAMMLRFLTGLPPGKVRFTIVDPVGLGENFAAFMHLADFDEKLVTSQIWTEPRLIEQRLTDLTEHIASVQQKYLRNQYESIEDYNRAAGEVAEPYRVLVVANFPSGFTPEAANRLISIAKSGPACGVCALVGVDARGVMPRDFALADLEGASFTLIWRDGRFTPKDAALAAFPITLDAPPGPATIARLAQQVGAASKDSGRVEVPFEYIAPKPEEVWRASAAKGFEVPVGRAGATRRQVFSLGRGTAQHALIAGKTGSGKSTLLHALITNLALNYSPEEAELYLIDFKEGVEFQWYATYRLPHARVVAIQSEREFGLSVLQRLDGILRERGEKFRDAGVNDLASYRSTKPDEVTPRILLVVDEFQMFFVEDDKLSQEAALILDRLVRQGRAFGIHVLLGSQSLGGAYSLPRTTLDQMAVRIALQSSEADANMILSKDNTAARLLSRPGEAIYNDQNGLTGGNDPFQVVWLAEEKREDLLRELGERAGGKYPPPLVFEGNSSADPEKNPALARVLDAPAWPTEPKAPAAWLGDPVAIKDPTVVAFRPQGAANLLLIGQNEEAARGLFAASLLGLAAQLPPGTAGHAFTILDGTPDDADDAEYLRKLTARLPHAVRAPARSELPAALADLAVEVDRRQKGETADKTPRFLFVFGVHRFRELRKSEDDFGFGRRGADRDPSPAERFATILREGPALGIHAVVWGDSLTNLNRTFDRPLLREFGVRVLFQMGPTDSSTLMDSPAASRLGRNRALLLQEEQERPEKFRPYGLPSAEWLDRATEQLRRRAGAREPVPAS
ncbi:MAG: ftsK [Gemmataceae bacterium]|nr:ftsK [Gemmataceae bacterium]